MENGELGIVIEILNIIHSQFPVFHFVALTSWKRFCYANRCSGFAHAGGLSGRAAVTLLAKSRQEHQAGAADRRSEGLRPPRPRRRGISHRHEVELCPERQSQAEISGLQRGRERAGNIQRPFADRARPPRDRRRNVDRGLCDPISYGVYLYSRRDGLRRQALGAGG